MWENMEAHPEVASVLLIFLAASILDMSVDGPWANHEIGIVQIPAQSQIEDPFPPKTCIVLTKIKFFY